MRLRHWIGLLLLAVTATAAQAHATPPAAGAVGMQPPQLGYDPEALGAEEIVVIGQRPRGALTGILPEIELDEEEIASFGASTVDELIDALAPQTRGGSGSGRPIVLVNGLRISSFAEIRDLPPEALARVEILPPEVALRYGYRADQRVVNLILRPRYRSIIGEAAHGFATEGGRGTYEGDVNITRIDPMGRWSLRANYQRTEALLESERDIRSGLGRFRTLLPSLHGASLNGTLTRELSDNVSATLNARVEAREGSSRVGLPPGFGDPDESGVIAVRPLIRDSQSRTAHAGLSVQGDLAGWQWLFTGNYDRSWNVIRTDIPWGDGISQPDRRRERARYSGRTAEAQLLVHGSIAALPAGNLYASFRTSWESQAYTSRTSLADLPGQIRRARHQANGQVTLDIPILGGGSGGLAAIGDLSVNLDLEVNRLSDFGTLRRVSFGGRWAPVPRLSLMASIANEESAPSIQNLGEPAILTPNVRVFDFTRGEAVDVSRLDGGNRGLLAEELRRVRLGLSARPLPSTDLTLTATYSAIRTRNPTGFLPAPTPELEAAFADRFVRDAAGRLLRIDARPVNFARSEREELRWGANLSLPLRRVSAPREGDADALPREADGRVPNDFDLRRLTQSEGERRGRLQLAFYHNWRLRDRILVRSGLPQLDFLNGSAAGSRGGRPRHELEFQGAVLRDGFGARLSAKWQSGSRVRTLSADAGARTLSFSGQATVDVRLFANLGEQHRLARRASWLRGSRLTIQIENVFNSRPRVRDANGVTPAGLQPARLDPLGRSVRISFRKLF